MSLSFDIGSSDCEAHRLVSLTRDYYSVFIDLSGGRDLLELTGEWLLYAFRFFCQGLSDDFPCQFSILFSSISVVFRPPCSLRCFVELAADGYYMHNEFLVKGFLETQP